MSKTYKIKDLDWQCEVEDLSARCPNGDYYEIIKNEGICPSFYLCLTDVCGGNVEINCRCESVDTAKELAFNHYVSKLEKYLTICYKGELKKVYTVNKLKWEVEYFNKARLHMLAKTSKGTFSIFVDNELSRNDNVELFFEDVNDYGVLGNYETVKDAESAANKYLSILFKPGDAGIPFPPIHKNKYSTFK